MDNFSNFSLRKERKREQREKKTTEKDEEKDTHRKAHSSDKHGYLGVFVL